MNCENTSKTKKIKCYIFYFVLYLIGLICWIIFFNYNTLNYTAFDWPKEYGHYFILKNSLLNGVIPFHVSTSFLGTNRFLAIPEMSLSPQMLILSFMSVQWYMLINTLLLYSIGLIGLILIKKKYNMSMLAFVFLWLLFNFNGHITSHIAVGHSQWLGYFILPFFFIYLAEFLENPVSPKLNTKIKISISLFAILLQGGLHIYVHCIFFLLLILIFNIKYFWHISSIILLSFLMSSIQIVPAVLTFWNYKHGFLSGYPSINTLIDALTMIKSHRAENIGGIYGTLGWWEYDIYITFIGFCAIIYFGIYHSFFKRYNTYQLIIPPVLIMFLFSLFDIFRTITVLPIPLISSERVSSRLILLPFLFLLIISAVQFSEYLKGKGVLKKTKLLFIFLLFIMILSLFEHLSVWKIDKIEKQFSNVVLNNGLEIIQQKDFLYKTLFSTSAILSILVFVFSVFMLLYSNKRQKRT